MTFERWDVLTALFPFVESARRKPRPVLVLSGSDFNDAHDHIVTAMITTAAAGRWASDHSVTDLAAAGLLRPCVVRWKIFRCPKNPSLARSELWARRTVMHCRRPWMMS